jgi:hypothetical protein
MGVRDVQALLDARPEVGVPMDTDVEHAQRALTVRSTP